MSDPLAELSDRGVSIWPDDLSRLRLVSGSLADLAPKAALRAVADHGRIPEDSVRGHYADAQQVLDRLAPLGVDYDDVTAYLEDHGLAIFDASWRDLGDQLAAQLRRPARQEN